MNKFLKIFSRVILGVFLFYLLMGFIIIPFVLSIIIEKEGTKFLKHPVTVRSVALNPLFCDLTINDLTVKDAGNNVLIGFDKFKIDISFLNLFRKIYRVELLSLDGLKINATLSQNGQINLLDLIPTPQSTPPVKTDLSTSSAPYPLVIVDLIHVSHGTIQFLDKSVQPNFLSALNDLDIAVTGLTTRPEDKTKVVVQSKINGKGSISSQVELKPLKQPIELETTVTIDKYALDVLSPYTGKYVGRKLQDGQFDFRTDYRIVDNKLTASHKILIQKFTFGEKVESKDALNLPVGLAVALLEDPQGRINISLPVTGDLSDPQFHYWHVVGQVISNFFVKLVTKPFSILSSVLGTGESTTDELAYVRFLPGETNLSDEEKNKLVALIKLLNERPKLNLVVNGGYDSDIDWKAIKVNVFTRDFEHLIKETTRDENWVYQELYQRRFGIRALWSMTGKYKLKAGGYDFEALNAEIKKQIINAGKPDLEALETLAQSRANLIYDFILHSGFNSQRVKLGKNLAVQASMGFVPSEFTLTVVDASDSDFSEKNLSVEK